MSDMNELVEREEFLEQAVDALQQTKRLLRPGLKIFRMSDGSVTTSSSSLYTLATTKARRDSVVTDMVTAACQKAESISPCSSYFIVGLALKVLKASPTARSALGKELLSISTESSRPATQASLGSIVTGVVPDVAAIALEAIKLAGAENKVFIENTTSAVPTIERMLGNSFTCAPDPSFFRNGKWTASDVKCLVIDGVVENVSEIDALLERCHANRRAMVIFARGFGRDVLTTLRTNFARRTLNVIPVDVKFDLETANVLLDIATVMGGDVISSLKGDLISTTKYDSVSIVESVTCHAGSATLTCVQNPGVHRHLQELLRKRSQETLPVVRQILDRRIRSLSASSVVVRVNDAGAAGGKLLHELDVALRLTRDVLLHGVISADAIQPRLNAVLPGVLDDIAIDPMPASWCAVARRVSIGLAESLLSVSFIMGERPF